MSVPSKFDRGSLERVLARAAELQAAQQARETGEGLTEAQLVELGREVGLDATALRQAMAEEQSRAIAPRDTSMTTRLLGAASVWAERTVAGTPVDVLAALDEWMKRQEYLQIKRRHAVRLVWEPQRDVAASLARTVERTIGGKEHAFSRAVDVSAFVSAVDASRVHVRLDADLSPVRAAMVTGGAGMAAVGVGAAGILFALGFMPVIAALPALVTPVGGWAIARGFRGPVARAQLALERLLDRLEAGELKRRGSLIDALKQAALPPGGGRG